MIQNKLFQEYCEIIYGKRKTFSDSFFPTTNTKSDVAHKNALKVFSYAIEDFLHLSPEQARKKLKKTLANQMCLDLVIDFIKFPPEFFGNYRYEYILSQLYPEHIVLDKEEYVVRYYKDILDNDKHFAYGYFMQEDSREKTLICVRYIIEHEMFFESISELYSIFGSPNTDSLNTILNRCKLKHPCYELYDERVELLHKALPEEQRNDFLYHNYLFQSYKKKMMKTKKTKLSKLYTLSEIPNI